MAHLVEAVDEEVVQGHVDKDERQGEQCLREEDLHGLQGRKGQLTHT